MKAKSLIFSVCFMLFAGLSQGQTWDFNKRLTYTPGNSELIKSALDSGNGLHMVWHDNSQGNYEIYWKLGLLAGTVIWSDTKRLTWNSEYSMYPSICINKDDDIHVVWEDITTGSSDLYHKYSTDSGNTWSNTKRITWTTSDTGTSHISSSQDGNVHLFYRDDSSGDYEIYYKQFNSSTKTWGALKRLTYTSGNAYIPCGGVVNGDIHVVWPDNSYGNYELFHKISTNNGSSWSSSMRITYNSGRSRWPQFVGFTPSGTTNSYLHLTWYDNTSGASEVYYKKWSAASGTWQGLKRLTWVSTSTAEPTIAVDSNHNLHVIYSVKSPDKNDLFHKKSVDIGVNWSGVTRLTWGSGLGISSQWPYLIINHFNDDLLLGYSRFVTIDNPECYFKRGSQGGI